MAAAAMSASEELPQAASRRATSAHRSDNWLRIVSPSGSRAPHRDGSGSSRAPAGCSPCALHAARLRLHAVPARLGLLRAAPELSTRRRGMLEVGAPAAA